MNRQKILVFMMSLAIGYAVYVLGVDHFGRAQEQSGNTQYTADAQKILLNAQAILNKQQVTPLDKYRLQSASEPWANSPFFQRKIEEPTPVSLGPLDRFLPAIAKEKKLVYDGYVETGRELWAVINGRDYRPGEQVENTEFVVLKIRKSEVVLERKATEGREGERKVLQIADFTF
ncbi:MAG: hypothetical protein ACNI3A_07130 [Desulfovibrio sp.]|uniref:hypothetical protein n=1 Tax=Desulfovibrio sp. 7SRBS1 TaxID=3378064 RepID=UPI003B4147C7